MCLFKLFFRINLYTVTFLELLLDSVADLACEILDILSIAVLLCNLLVTFAFRVFLDQSQVVVQLS